MFCGFQGVDKACPIFEVPIGATSVYVEQDTPDFNLLGEYSAHSAQVNVKYIEHVLTFQTVM